MPRQVTYHSGRPTGDPQTLLQDDKDPMLTLNPDYLDCRPDPDPAGDLGKRGIGGDFSPVLTFCILADSKSGVSQIQQLSGD